VVEYTTVAVGAVVSILFTVAGIFPVSPSASITSKVNVPFPVKICWLLQLLFVTTIPFSHVSVATTLLLVGSVVEYSIVPVNGIAVILIPIFCVYFDQILSTSLPTTPFCQSVALPPQADRLPSFLIPTKVSLVDTIFTNPVPVGAPTPP
jgi:hypothetical protein